MVDILLQSAGKNEDVVQVNKRKLVQEVSEDVIDFSLKTSGGVSEAKQPHQVLIVAPVGVKHCLLDPDEVICFPEVEFGVIVTALEEREGGGV